MSKKQEELLKLQTSAEETNTDNKNYPLIEREQIGLSPLWIIGNKDQGYRIACGKYLLTESHPKEKINDLLENQLPYIIAQMTGALVETILEIKIKEEKQ